jgi:hypothetical protein
MSFQSVSLILLARSSHSKQEIFPDDEATATMIYVKLVLLVNQIQYLYIPYD